MGWISDEAVGLFCPGLADVFVRREAVESLETPSKVVGGDEVGQVPPQLLMGLVVVALHGRLLAAQCRSSRADLDIKP